MKEEGIVNTCCVIDNIHASQNIIISNIPKNLLHIHSTKHTKKKSLTKPVTEASHTRRYEKP